MNRGKWLLIVLIMGVVLLLGTPAWSDDDSLQKAKELHQEYNRLSQQGRYAEAIPYATKVLVICEKVLGPDNPSTATALNNLALLYESMGTYDKAEPLHRRSLAIREKVLGAEHPDTAISLNNLAALYFKTGTYDKAEPLYRRALAIWEKALRPEHSLTGTALNNLAALYYKTGNYDKAEPLYKRSLAIKEKVLGPEHRDTARALHDLAAIYYYMGSYDKAIPFYKQSLAIREKILGPEHPTTIATMSNLGGAYEKLGDYNNTEPLYIRSLAISEKVLGPEHPATASSLYYLARLYREMGNYEKAEPLCRRSLAVREKVLGPEHPDTAASLNGLATLYETKGAYDRAEPLYRRALTIEEKALGSEHPDTAVTLNNMAKLYNTMGAYDRAEPLYRRALAITEKARPEHPATAIALNNLAKFYQDMGAYDKAEPLCRRSLAISEKVLGPEHPDTAVTLNNMAKFYQDMGAYDKAEPLYRRSLAISEKVLGPEHPLTVTTLSNLAGFYDKLGDYNRAEPLLRRSLAISEKVLGPEHPETARALNNLAYLHKNMETYDKAEPLYNRSLAILEKIHGPDHPDIAASLNNLALLYECKGLYDKAESLGRRSLTIREKTLGPDHSYTAQSLINLAGMYAKLGRNSDALALLERGQGINDRQIAQILGFASEEQQSKFLTTSTDALHIYLGLVFQHFRDDAKAKQKALDVWFARKGILMEAQKNIRDILATGEDPQAAESFSELTRIREGLAGLVLGGPGKEGVETYRKHIAELTYKKETLEGKLSRLSQFFAKKRKTSSAAAADVAALLPRASVLIEIARIRDSDFKENKWAPFRYQAFILPSGKVDGISLIDLGDAKEIDEKVNALQKSLRNLKTPNETLAAQSRELYQMVFVPLKASIGTARTLFLSPDGILNFIPFEILRDDRGDYLIDTYTFNYISAGRDIAGYGMITEKGQKSLLMGDPDFDLAARTMTEAGERPLTRSRQMQGLSFSRLPGTKEEVEAIAAILGSSASDTYTGERARESVLMKSKSPRILHLATHGFFLSDQDWSSLMYDKSRGITITAKETPSVKKPVRMENPLLRSGLALAGANSSLSQEGVTEGILTAEKILGLNLRGTDLVVLSACETGVGAVRNGEGVYGLRRAFTQAGAKSLVMSLWEVPDRETKELMLAFYKNLQSGKMNRAEALRDATLKQREIVKTRYGHDNPYYWGAFVFLGEAE